MYPSTLDSLLLIHNSDFADREINTMKQAPVLTDAQVKKLLKMTSATRHSARNRLVIILSYYVGLRACEIASLKVGDVLDGEGNIKDTVLLTKDMTKGSKANSVYLSDFVQKEIKRYLESNAERLVTLKSPLIYSQRTGGHFSSQTLQILFKTLYSNVGINASSHSGRRKFITDLSEKGVSVRVIQELARHRDLATTQRYIDVSVDKLRNAVNLVGI
jgi:integrase/recombinase XerD